MKPIFLNKLRARKPKSKYGASRTKWNGRMYDSKKEAARAKVLQALAERGEITELREQVRLPLMTHRLRDGKEVPIQTATGRQMVYVVDFAYKKDGEQVYEDVKGLMLPLAALKIAIVEAMHDTKVLIT